MLFVVRIIEKFPLCVKENGTTTYVANVAGPRASKSPSIYDETVKILERVIK